MTPQYIQEEIDVALLLFLFRTTPPLDDSSIPIVLFIALLPPGERLPSVSSALHSPSRGTEAAATSFFVEQVCDQSVLAAGLKS